MSFGRHERAGTGHTRRLCAALPVFKEVGYAMYCNVVYLFIACVKWLLNLLFPVGEPVAQ